MGVNAIFSQPNRWRLWRVFWHIRNVRSIARQPLTWNGVAACSDHWAELSWNSFWVIYKLILFTRLQKEQPSHGSWSDKRKMLIIKCYVLVIFFVFRLCSNKVMNHKKRVYAENIFLLYLFFFFFRWVQQIFQQKALRRKFCIPQVRFDFFENAVNDFFNGEFWIRKMFSRFIKIKIKIFIEIF